MNDSDIVKLIEKQIEPSYLAGSSLFLQENTAATSTYNSVLIKSPTTRYRNIANGNKSFLFCRIKNNKGLRYVSFSSKYENDFTAAGFVIKKIASDKEFIRINIDEFVQNIEQIKPTLNKIFRNSFSFEAFGCCSKYKECSNAEYCLHEDLLYATACMYRQNLESGNNFYKG